MGFIGSLRNLVAKSFKSGKLDYTLASKTVGAEAKKLTTDLSSLFSTRLLRDVDGKAHLGSIDLNDFLEFSRQGNYARSFGPAFSAEVAMNNVAVRRTIENLLADARKTLPDLRMAQNAESVALTKSALSLEGVQLNSFQDLEQALAKNTGLHTHWSRLVDHVKRSRAIKMFGYTILISSAAAVTYELVFSALQKAVNEGDGCFAYWLGTNGEINRCKVAAYSCANPNTENPCVAGVIPADVIASTDCMKDSGTMKFNCIHCDMKDPLNAAIPENVSLRCETKTMADAIADAIGSTVGWVANSAGGWLHNVFIYGVMFIAVIVVLIVVMNLVRLQGG